MKKPNLDEIVKAFHNAGIPSKLSENQSRVLIEVWQSVAHGQPVSHEQVKEIASKHQIHPKEAYSFLNMVSEYDEDGNILGVFGLTLKDYHHRFQLKGYTMSTAKFHVNRLLSTWCAWDALFLPSLLKGTAVVRSTCPQTKSEIQLTISPDEVKEYEPATTVLSIVLPEAAPKKRTAGEIWMIFCKHVLFFSSIEALNIWFEEKEYDPIVLSVEEGYQLGHLAFHDLLKLA